MPQLRRTTRRAVVRPMRPARDGAAPDRARTAAGSDARARASRRKNHSPAVAARVEAGRADEGIPRRKARAIGDADPTLPDLQPPVLRHDDADADASAARFNHE